MWAAGAPSLEAERTRLQARFHGCSGRSCEFAETYVIAHEVGHHVQNLFGILLKVTRIQREGDRPSANHLQVQVELQADCLAGVWAHHSQEKWKFIEPGDVEAAMQTAAAIGDDRLQRRGPRRLHARLVRATRPLVHDRAAIGKPIPVQHLRGRRALKSWRPFGQAAGTFY